jgi:hypothetical protein
MPHFMPITNLPIILLAAEMLEAFCLCIHIWSFLTVTVHHRYLMGRLPRTRLPPVTSWIVDSAAIYCIAYYGGENLKYYIWPPHPQFSLHRRAALTTNSNGTQPAHKGKGWGGGSLDNLLMSVYAVHQCWETTSFLFQLRPQLRLSERKNYAAPNPTPLSCGSRIQIHKGNLNAAPATP